MSLRFASSCFRRCAAASCSGRARLDESTDARSNSPPAALCLCATTLSLSKLDLIDCVDRGSWQGGCGRWV